jgi:group I intron endonuclease
LSDHNSSLICKALLKYGHSAFTLEVLEYCEPGDAIAREQYYLDLFKPEYNILPTAGSSYGHLRSEETQTKISQARLGSVHFQETKDKIAAALLGNKHSEESRAKMKARVFSEMHLTNLRSHLAELNAQKSIKIKITDIETNTTTE